MMDVIDAMLDDAPGAAVRQQRPDFVRYSQGSYDVLIVPQNPGGLSLTERAAAAWRIATLNGDAGLTAHYRGLVPAATMSILSEGTPLPPRLATILAHVERVATAPGAAAPEHLRALEAVGLSARDIVALSQLIAFVSYQVRVLAGMRLLIGEQAA
jgi:uncharacterized protein YciW